MSKRYQAKCENSVYNGHLMARWYVLDTQTGAQFNCNSCGHAAEKASQMNAHDLGASSRAGASGDGAAMTLTQLFDAAVNTSTYIKMNRRQARKFSRIPKCGYEIVVSTRIVNGHKQTLWLQNVSNVVFQFWTHTDVNITYEICYGVAIGHRARR